MKACPWITTVAVRWVFSPRIGLSLAFSRQWSHSTRLFSYWPVLCNAAGTSSSITFANPGAPSVMTSPGSPWTARAAVKNARADPMSRRRDPVPQVPAHRQQDHLGRDERTLTLSRIVASLDDRASRPTRDSIV